MLYIDMPSSPFFQVFSLSLDFFSNRATQPFPSEQRASKILGGERCLSYGCWIMSAPHHYTYVSRVSPANKTWRLAIEFFPPSLRYNTHALHTNTKKKPGQRQMKHIKTRPWIRKTDIKIREIESIHVTVWFSDQFSWSSVLRNGCKATLHRPVMVAKKMTT